MMPGVGDATVCLHMLMAHHEAVKKHKPGVVDLSNF